jgi:hypothetical protein
MGLVWRASFLNKLTLTEKKTIKSFVHGAENLLSSAWKLSRQAQNITMPNASRNCFIKTEKEKEAEGNKA